MFWQKGFVKTYLKITLVSRERLVLEKDNPSICDFGFNNNSIRNQKIFRPVAGNVCGKDIGMVDFTNEALPCRNKPKKDWIRSCHIVTISPIINSSSNKNGYFNSQTQNKHLQLKSKEDLEDWIIWEQLSTVKSRFVLCILLCAIFDIKYTLSLK